MNRTIPVFGILILLFLNFYSPTEPPYDTTGRHLSDRVIDSSGNVSAAAIEGKAETLRFTDIQGAGSEITEKEPERSAGRKGYSVKAVFGAFKKAYPDKVEDVAFRMGDWAIKVGGEWFFWAGGRLLPEEEREKWEGYTPYPFYAYPGELPPLPQLTKEEKRDLENRLQKQETDPPLRHPGFYDAIWRIHDMESSWQRVKTIYFLRYRTEIHRELLEDLAAVEEDIEIAASEDEELRRFIKSIQGLTGYNWRPVAGTSTLSFHSYGAAIDIIPKDYKGKQVYWRWAKPIYPEWYSLPYSERYMPPLSFIRAFEKHGFIWGGKWFYFDTIHFEYRPEILILNDMY